MLFKRFERSIYRNLTELCTTPARVNKVFIHSKYSVLLVHRSMSNVPSHKVYRNHGKFEHCKLLLELFRLIAMNCGQKLFNPPSCAARLLQQMTMTCGRITNYTSCVAREPLWRTITVHNQNTTQARCRTRTFVVLLSSDEQSGADETSKFSRSIPHSSKSGSRSVLLHYVTKTRAQCPVHISINGRLRCNYGSDTRNTDTSSMVATISNSSCSVESTSVNNPEKTGRVQKTFKGNETENHLEFRFTEL